jgi:hypothetical protein
MDSGMTGMFCQTPSVSNRLRPLELRYANDDPSREKSPVHQFAKTFKTPGLTKDSSANPKAKNFDEETAIVDPSSDKATPLTGTVLMELSEVTKSTVSGWTKPVPVDQVTP